MRGLGFNGRPVYGESCYRVLFYLNVHNFEATQDDDDEESDEDVSDEEESFRREVKKNKQLYSYERRSARNRKCLKEKTLFF